MIKIAQNKVGFLSMAVASAALVLSGCKANPFPEDGRTKSDTPPIEAQEVRDFTIVDPPQIEVSEGTPTTVPVTVRSTLPGTLSLQLMDAASLPRWVSFDPATSQLTLNPDFEAANDPQEIRRTSRVFDLKFKVRSSQSGLIGAERIVKVEVKDTPRAFTLTASPPNPTVSEGATLSLQLLVQDQDFPNRQPQFLIEGRPVDATTAPGTNPNVYTLQYTPSFNTVLRTDPDFPVKRRTLRILVINPRGREIAQDVTLTVNDVRQPVIWSGPTNLRGNTSMGTQIRIDDPNGEGAPEVTLVRGPGFGNFGPLLPEQSNDGTNGFPAFSVYSLSWLDIPPNRLGSTASFEVRGCNFRGAANLRDNCLGRTYNVRLEGTSALTPAITRSAWAIGETRYVKVGQTVTAPIRLVDRDATPRAITATVGALRGGVTAALGVDNSEIRVTGISPGSAAAQITATSSMGLSTTEVFFVEVLRADWENNVIIAGGAGNIETQRYADAVPSSYVLYSSAESRFLEHTMALKRGGLVGSSGISNTAAMGIFMAARQQFSTWILASPLVGGIPSVLRTELETAGVVFDARLALGSEVNRNLIPTAAGVTAGFVLGAGVTADLVGLAGTENARIQTLSVRPGSTACTPMIQLNPNTTSTVVGRQTVMLRCTIGTRSVFVSGFDFTDLMFVGEARGVSTLRGWFTRMLP